MRGGRAPKQLITLLGRVGLQRLYYYCRHCRQGVAPRDRELDVEGTQYSPGVRRLQALVGSAAPFAQGQALLAELAGLQVSVKSVERKAEAVGGAFAARQETDRQGAALLGFPPQAGAAIPILYIAMDGTGMPVTTVTTAAAAGRKGQAAGRRTHARSQVGLRLHADRA